MWMQHYNANAEHKESWRREIWIGYNIELAEYVYSRKMYSNYKLLFFLVKL